MNNKIASNDVHKIIDIFINDFIFKKFDISILENIFFFENNNLYKVILNKKKISYIHIDQVSNISRCDLLILSEDLQNDKNIIEYIMKFNANDLVFIFSKNKKNPSLSEIFLKNNFIEFKEFNKDLKINFKNLTTASLLKKIDNPNLDSSLLIQSICNDNGDKYIMMGYKKKSLQYYFKKITNEIQKSFNEKTHLSYLRFGDGDFYLLRNLNHGSAKIGSRSVLNKINSNDLRIIRKSFWKNKNICIERTYDSYNRIFFEVLFSKFDDSKFFSFLLNILNILKLRHYTNKFFILVLTSNKLKFMGRKKFFYKIINFFIRKKIIKYNRKDLINNFQNCNFLPFEGIYALVATRWLFKNYKKNIAVVGNIEKINLIKSLSKNKSYLDYLGIDKFADFIEIPQKGAASDLNLSEIIKKKIEESDADIFLFGIGSMKMHLFPLLKDINKIFIDVGCGIDALAGVVSQDRPYFSRWINYQFENFSLENIDLMDQNNPLRFAKKYTTVYIKKNL